MTQAIIKYRAHVQCACGTECETDVVQFDCGLEPGAMPQGWKTGVGGPFCPRCSENNEAARFALGRSACDDAPAATECAVCLGSLEFGWNQRNGDVVCAACLGSLEFGWNQRNGDVVCAACSSAPCASGSKR